MPKWSKSFLKGRGMNSKIYRVQVAYAPGDAPKKKDIEQAIEKHSHGDWAVNVISVA